jgi:hypothetical protein
MPDRLRITELHKKWWGQYNILEDNHGYIQWIFPIREHGMNYHAQPLQLHEIERMKANPVVIERIITSYTLMLDFYGMKLVSSGRGLLKRSENYKARYRNLLERPHNFLRITRILKCLSELGLEHMNVGFLLHVLNEQSEGGNGSRTELNSSSIRNSMDRWWANCLRQEEDWKWVRRMIKRVRQDQDFVFTRAMYEYALESRSSNGRLAEQEGTQ